MQRNTGQDPGNATVYAEMPCIARCSECLLDGRGW